nr:MAG TPA: hypothetical protein [Caudoviricetes sp.]
MSAVLQPIRAAISEFKILNFRELYLTHHSTSGIINL